MNDHKDYSQKMTTQPLFEVELGQKLAQQEIQIPSSIPNNHPEDYSKSRCQKRPPPPPPPLMPVPYNNYQKRKPEIVIYRGGRIPKRVDCPFCRRQTQTIIRRVPGQVTWIWCFLLCLITWSLCFIPFFIKSCKNVQMVCKRCGQVKAIKEADWNN